MSRETNKDLPRLLRALASSDSARERRHDIVLNAAADELEAAWKSDQVQVPVQLLKKVIANLGQVKLPGPGNSMGDDAFELRKQLKELTSG